MNKILVTGGNGFIGSHICKRLADEGNEVNVLVRETSDLSLIKNIDLKFHYGDITQPKTLIEPLKNIDKVIHVAGLAADWGPYYLFEKINFFGTQNVAMAADKAGVKRFVHISTVAFHGFGKQNMTEDSPPAKKLIPYAKTKYLAEKWLWNFDKETNMEISTVRPGNVFGINDHTFISKYIDALLKGKFAEINHGKSKTCPVYVDNLVNIIMLALNETKAAGNAYLATDGLDITWHEFNTALANALNIPLPRTSIPYPVAMTAASIYYKAHQLLHIKSEPFLTPYRVNNGGKDYHFSIEKLKKHFNYSPETNLKNALNKTVKWYKNSIL